MKKTTNRIIAIVAAVFLVLFFIRPINARGGIFVIEPRQEAVESLPFLKITDSAAGNVSANGYIDFYILGPDGTMLQRYNRTDFIEFKVSPNEDGNCTLHMANVYESKNVTVTLQYNIAIVVVGTAIISFHTVASSTFTAITSAEPFDWGQVVDLIKNIGSFIVTIAYPLARLIKSFIDWLKNLRWKRWWKKKYGKPGTPSTTIDPSDQLSARL